jgi:DeoR/GlpR family transcriptional regulator of sugar metabolism
VGRTGFTPISAIDDVDVLVTDEDADKDEIARLRDRNITVLLV